MTALAALRASDRGFWLPGLGVGVLHDDDVSLTFDATARTVLRHVGGRSEAVGDDVFAVLEQEAVRDPAVLWVGYLGYACRTDLPGRPTDPASGVPDAVWLRLPADRLLAAPPDPGRGRAPSLPPREPVTPEPAVPDWYRAAFEEVQRQLRLGNSYEVNLTYREALVSHVDPLTAYLRLAALNPAPHAGYLRHGAVHLVGASPERYAAVDADRVLEARPIKGTTPRAPTPADDVRQRARLATDPRYRAENLMIVDLLRNDLSMVCEPGSVTVPGLMEVEQHPSVHQLVSTVRGRLREGVSTVAALRALFPAGSMTGAPKRRTMEIVDAVEATPRGVYAGAFGWISGDGRADLAVVIRSLLATPHVDPSLLQGRAVTSAGSSRHDSGWRYAWGTGGGITVRSTVEEEWAETRWKAARLRAAVEPGSHPDRAALQE